MSSFSVLVLLWKDILAFFQGSFGFQWLKEQEKKEESKGSQKGEILDLACQPLLATQHLPAQHLSMCQTMSCLLLFSPGDTYLYPQNFIAIC